MPDQDMIRRVYEAAMQGDAQAARYLGECYRVGNGVPKSEEQARAWFRYADSLVSAVSSNPSSGVGTGFVSSRMNVPPPTSGVSPSRYDSRVDGGSRDTGHATGRRATKARRPIVLVCVLFIVVLSIVLAIVIPYSVETPYETYLRCVKTGDEKKALKYLRQAVAEGNPDAQYALGYRYYTGDGVSEDHDVAYEFFEKAAEQEQSDALYELGVYWDPSQEVDKKRNDWETALNFYRRAAENGNLRAWIWFLDSAIEYDREDTMYELGRLYLRGKGVQKNEDLAMMLLANSKKSNAEEILESEAKKGKSVALFYLARMKREGELELYKRAGELYSQAVEQGNEHFVQFLRKTVQRDRSHDGDAELCLAMCYEYGYGVKKDQEKALQWYCRSAGARKGGAEEILRVLEKAAEQGNSIAAYYSGCFYVMSICDHYTKEQKYEKSAKWLNQAVEHSQEGFVNFLHRMLKKGEQTGCAEYCLSVCYGSGKGVEKNDAESMKWCGEAIKLGYGVVPEKIEEAAAKGDATAQYYLGMSLENSSGTPLDVPFEATKWISQSAAQGFAPAQYQLGKYKRKRPYIDVFSEDTHAAGQSYLRLFRDAAEQGYVPAMCEVADSLMEGEGGNKDVQMALAWYARAAEKGDTETMCKLGDYFMEGKVVKQDTREAVKWYCLAAENGVSSAQSKLEHIVEEGKDGALEAMQWFLKKAKQGAPESQRFIGKCYKDGIGVKVDMAEAVKWYCLAAENGDSYAQSRLEHILVEGKAGAGASEAMQWFLKKAEQGDSESQHFIGKCYKEGIGVKSDLAEAVKWLRRSLE